MKSTKSSSYGPSMMDIPKTSLLRKRMLQGGLVRATSTDRHYMRSTFTLIAQSAGQVNELPGDIVFRAKKHGNARLHHSELYIKGSQDSIISQQTFLTKKKHFRDTEEWKTKKRRIIVKLRMMGKFNLALVLSRLPFTMTAIFDMTRRVTMHDTADAENFRHQMDPGEVETNEDFDQHFGGPQNLLREAVPSTVTIDKLPDKVLMHIFEYLSPLQTLQVGQVCKRWRHVALNPSLWKFVSFRPSYGGLQVAHPDTFSQLIGTRFSELKIAELATDLITPHVIHEMANKCPKLAHLTLDFSTAMQLHDFTDLQCFPSRLKSLTLCLSENIFLEGFLRKVYTFISSVEILHIIGTYEKVEDEEEEVYETVNVFKLKQYLPNIRVVNLWGVPFITDEHVDALSSNCAHLECLCVNYCQKVTGSCLKLVLQRCKKLKTLFLAHARLDNATMQSIEWEKTRIEELDIRGTEINAETLISILTRLPNLRWLDASWLENMTDAVIEAWMTTGSLNNLQYLNLDTCDSLNEPTMTEFIMRHGHQLRGLNLGGHHKLLEYFWMNMISQLRNINVLVMGIAEDCCPKVTAKIHIDQFIDCIAQNCPRLTRLEIRWDDDTLRFSDKSSKFIDVMRMKCLKLHSMVLSDGQYYELVRSNFERADRMSVVRTTEMCRSGILHCSKYYNQLLFN